MRHQLNHIGSPLTGKHVIIVVNIIICSSTERELDEDHTFYGLGFRSEANVNAYVSWRRDIAQSGAEPILYDC